MGLEDYHARVRGGVRWRIVRQGVDVEGRGLIDFNRDTLEAVQNLLHDHGPAMARASIEFKVPVELIGSIAATNSRGELNESFVWRQPGYVGDELTPELVAAGICRMTLSAARFFLKQSDMSHKWLLDAGNAFRATAAEIRFHRSTLRTAWDPVLTACACNAGGIYPDVSPDNPWKMRQYSLTLGFQNSALGRLPDPLYCTRVAESYAAVRRLVDGGSLDGFNFVSMPEPLGIGMKRSR